MVKNNKTKCSRVRVSVKPSSVQKAVVFRQLWKDRSDGASLMAGGRLFQARAARDVSIS